MDSSTDCKESWEILKSSNLIPLVTSETKWEKSHRIIKEYPLFYLFPLKMTRKECDLNSLMAYLVSLVAFKVSLVIILFETKSSLIVCFLIEYSFIINDIY